MNKLTISKTNLPQADMLPRAISEADFAADSAQGTDSSMDEVQAAFYQLRFREAFLEKKGTEFQDWFVKLADYAFGSDFEAVRPYGNQGDLKCDGRRVSTGTIFQCYAPYEMKEAELSKKINDDFLGAYKNWKDMAEWVLVHNDARGLPAASLQLIDQLRKGYPNVKIEVWTETELQKLFIGLPLYACQALFGYAPSKTGMETLMLDDIKPVIEELQRTDPIHGQEPLTPPSVDKLTKNSLSDDAANLLRVGRRKEALVETWFSKSPNADLGESIAEAFRCRYDHLKANGRSADAIFMHLQQYAGMDGEPKQQNAALAVLSYFFERCDIFEDPEEGSDSTDQTHPA